MAKKYILKEEAATLVQNKELLKQYSLFFIPGGRLMFCDWEFNDLLDEGSHNLYDVTDDYRSYLLEKIQFDSNLKLKDIFLFVNQHIDFFDPIIGKCCKKICEQGLTNILPYTGDYDAEGLEYLELYHWTDEWSEDQTSVKTSSYWSFHGIGFVLKEEDNNATYGWSAGQRINWALGCSKPNEISDIPVRIKTTIDDKKVKQFLFDRLKNDHYGFTAQSVDEATFDVDNPSLLEALDEIFKEIIWFNTDIKNG